MSTLIKSVDKTNVKFQDTFKYTINVSFNGIVGDINNAKITDFFPNYLSYTLPSSIPFVESIIEEEVEGGTLVTFDFGQISDLGIAITININCEFILGTDSLTTFENTSDLYINDTLYESSTAPIVTLSTEEDFFIEKNIPVPTNRLGTPGGRVIFSITLKNKIKSQGGNGDPGAKIRNVEITDFIPPGLTIDSNYPIVGRDISPSEYKDTRYDGKEATITDNTLSFTIDEYYGTDYRIVCVCNVDRDISTDQLSNTANLYVDNSLRGSSTSTLLIGEPVYTGNITKYGPNYGDVGNYISFELSAGNYGNMDLENIIIEDIIPDNITPYRINTGSFHLDVLYIPTPEKYSIEYLVNNTEPYILLGTYDASKSQYVSLPSLEEGDKITNIRWNIPNLAVGMVSNQRIIIDGVITSSQPDNQFTNIGELTYEDDTGTNIIQATHLTDLNGKSELNLTKTRVTNKASFVPGDIVRYALRFNGSSSQIDNPVISDLIPNKLEYVGNEIYTFYDYFDNTTINSTNPEFEDIVPISKTIEENYNNTNQTLITYDLSKFSLRQKGQFTIEFDTRIKVGSTGDINNVAIIGNNGDNAIVNEDDFSYLDVDDRDKDGITDEIILRSNINTTNIQYYNSLSSDKKVKGALDETYSQEPDIGLTYEGGSVDYKLTISNMGNLPYNYIQIVDILPHIGDTGVISTNSNRLSQFPVYITDNITVQIVENNEVLSDINPLVEYSQSYDPVRFASSNFGDDTIGEDNDWTTVAPTDFTAIASLRITLDDYLLQPNQSIVVNLYGIAPFGVTPDLVAWNSIAVKSRYLNEYNETQRMLPIEPEKVGVRVQESNKANIRGITWLDENRNGNIDTNEPYLNGVTVRLLSSDMEILSTTVTTNNLDNSPGYYVFNNLDPGDYYIQFVRPDNMYYTLQLDNTQNKADSDTGLTSRLIIDDTTSSIDGIDGGFIQELDLVILLIDLINDDILSIDCSDDDLITQQIQNIIDKLLNIINLSLDYFQSKLDSSDIKDLGYKSQVQKLTQILTSLSNILNNIIVEDNICNNNLLSYMIRLFMEISILLMKLLEENYSLTDKYNNCPCFHTNLFNIMMGHFINNITLLESLILDASNILLYMNAEQNYVPQNYVASYMPRSKIVPPPIKPNQFHCCPIRPCNRNNNLRK